MIKKIKKTIRYGTTIVAIQNSQMVVIAADGMGTFVGGGKQKSQSEVKKLFEYKDNLFGVSGLVKHHGGDFDVAKIVEASIQDGQTVPSTINKLETNISEALKKFLLKIKTNEPDVFKNETEGDKKGTCVILAHWENGWAFYYRYSFRCKVK